MHPRFRPHKTVPTNFLRKSDRRWFSEHEEICYIFSYHQSCQVRFPKGNPPSPADELNIARHEISTFPWNMEQYLSLFVHAETPAHLRALSKCREELINQKQRQQERFVAKLNQIDDVDQYLRFIENGTGKIPPPEKTDNERRIAQRRKPIQYGYLTREYQAYRVAVPMERRGRRDPKTPDPEEPISKRNFEEQVKKWRRELHRFDTNPENAGLRFER